MDFYCRLWGKWLWRECGHYDCKKSGYDEPHLCVYCGRDATPYDEHKACLSTALDNTTTEY